MIEAQTYRLLPTKHYLKDHSEENNNNGNKDSNSEVRLFFSLLN